MSSNEDWIKYVSGGVVTAIATFVSQQLGWIRFKKKDKAEVDTIQADISNKKVVDEIKISKAALEWTVQLAAQLERANLQLDKRQLEIESLHTTISLMKADFDKKIEEFEMQLQKANTDCLEEKFKNKELQVNLQKYIDTKSTNG